MKYLLWNKTSSPTSFTMEIFHFTLFLEKDEHCQQMTCIMVKLNNFPFLTDVFQWKFLFNLAVTWKHKLQLSNTKNIFHIHKILTYTLWKFEPVSHSHVFITTCSISFNPSIGSSQSCSYEGLTLETSALEILYSGQVTLSTQLIKPDNLFLTVSGFFLIAFLNVNGLLLNPLIFNFTRISKLKQYHIFQKMCL